jgi:hypothetical protein
MSSISVHIVSIVASHPSPGISARTDRLREVRAVVLRKSVTRFAQAIGEHPDVPR